MNNKKIEIITWMNDHCFDCGIPIKSNDKEHEGHKRLSDSYEDIRRSINPHWFTRLMFKIIQLWKRNDEN